MAFTHRNFYQANNGPYWDTWQYVPDGDDTVKEMLSDNYFKALLRQIKPLDRIEYATKDLSQAGTLIVVSASKETRTLIVRKLGDSSPEGNSQSVIYYPQHAPKTGWRVRNLETDEVTIDNLSSKEEALEYIKMMAA